MRPEDTITLQLFGENIPKIIGFGIDLEFDSNVITYAPGSFLLGDFLPGASPLAHDFGGAINAGGASLTGTTASGSGYLAELSFSVGEAFADSTFLIITSIGLSLAEGDSAGAIRDMPVRIIARLEETGSGIIGDFNNDGTVGFPDFLIFAQAFGSDNPQCDLNHDGLVGFRDFLIFAQNFGKHNP